jgi:hypothetical protein
MSDDLSTEEEGISTQDEDEDEEVEGGEKETEEEEDPLMTFLQGHKPENMTLNECRDILKAILVAQPTAILHATLLGTGSDGEAPFKELLTTGEFPCIGKLTSSNT